MFASTTPLPKGRRGRDRRVVGFTTTYVISVYRHWNAGSKPAHGEVYSLQHYVIKFVNIILSIVDTAKFTTKYSWEPV